jgi:hypothetical protein
VGIASRLTFQFLRSTPKVIFLVLLFKLRYEALNTGAASDDHLTGTSELLQLAQSNGPGMVGPAREISNCVFEDLNVTCQKLDELDIKAIIAKD